MKQHSTCVSDLATCMFRVCLLFLQSKWLSVIPTLNRCLSISNATGPIYVYSSTHLSSYIIVHEVFVQVFTLVRRPLISHSEVLNEWTTWSISRQWTWMNKVNHSKELKITSLQIKFFYYNFKKLKLSLDSMLYF